MSPRALALAPRYFCFLLVFAAVSYITPSALAQFEGLGNTTSTPVPGVPHDYITGLNEIVNPANGSVSVRIPQPYPHERNPNWPVLAFSYDSQASKSPLWRIDGQCDCLNVVYYSGAWLADCSVWGCRRNGVCPYHRRPLPTIPSRAC